MQILSRISPHQSHTVIVTYQAHTHTHTHTLTHTHTRAHTHTHTQYTHYTTLCCTKTHISVIYINNIVYTHTELRGPVIEEISALIDEIKTVYAYVAEQAVEHIHAKYVCV